MNHSLPQYLPLGECSKVVHAAKIMQKSYLEVEDTNLKIKSRKPSRKLKFSKGLVHRKYREQNRHLTDKNEWLDQ